MVSINTFLSSQLAGSINKFITIVGNVKKAVFRNSSLCYLLYRVALNYDELYFACYFYPGFWIILLSIDVMF